MKPKILIQEDLYSEYSRVYVNGQLEFENNYPDPPISYRDLMRIICEFYDMDCEVQVGQFVGENEFFIRQDIPQFKPQ